MAKQTKYPKWVVKHRKPGTQIRLINGIYYLYKVTSQWDKKKKRSVLKTHGILGKITRNGFIASEKRQLEKQYQNITVREYGLSYWLYYHNPDIQKMLKKYFPLQWEFILSAVYCRLAYQAPMKRYGFHLENSALSEWITTYRQIKTISSHYSQIGALRNEQVQFMKSLAKGSRFTLVDVTPVFSSSGQLGVNHLGYNSMGINKLQVNMLCIYSVDKQLPVFYRIIPGNVRDVRAFKDALEESQIKNVVIIADKGFYSNDNVQYMDEHKFRYILPLKRNSTLIDYTPTQTPNKKGWDGFVFYKKRVIWYIVTKLKINGKNKRIVLFMDETLHKEEQQDYLMRIEQGKAGYTMDSFQEKHPKFGTLAVITNLSGKYNAEDVYYYWKTRNYVEQVYDTLKTTLQIDSPYLREEKQLEGWMFINYLAVIFNYRLLNKLKESKLHGKYAVEDIIRLMLEIRQLKIGDTWKDAAVPQKYKDIMKAIGAEPIV